MEIGSFLELQLPKGREWYRGDRDIVRLNTGRAALWHAFRCTGARTIWLPYYQCDSVRDFFRKKGVSDIRFYHIDRDFNPTDLYAREEDAVMLVNYYGIMSHGRMSALAKPYPGAIIDNCQAFFCKPVEHAMSVYSCRKFLGVPDGAYVIGPGAQQYQEDYPQGYSSDTAAFLLMRVEYGCEGKGYAARSLNEHRIDAEDVMKMSGLTRYILDGSDYEDNRRKRRENFAIADSLLQDLNLLTPSRFMDDQTIPMVYPLIVEDDGLLQRLLDAKHFQGHWWSYLCDEMTEDCVENWLSRFMIPITIDQRYGEREIRFIADIVKNRFRSRV